MEATEREGIFDSKRLAQAEHDMKQRYNELQITASLECRTAASRLGHILTNLVHTQPLAVEEHLGLTLLRDNSGTIRRTSGGEVLGYGIDLPFLRIEDPGLANRIDRYTNGLKQSCRPR